jgi:hypothetical protein
MTEYRETNKDTLGEFLEFLGRVVKSTESFELSKDEYNALQSITNRLMDDINKGDFQVANYLTAALYRDTFIDEELKDHYADKENVPDSFVRLDTTMLSRVLVILFVGLMGMDLNYGVEEMYVRRSDVSRVVRMCKDVMPYLPEDNRKELSALVEKMMEEGDVK